MPSPRPPRALRVLASPWVFLPALQLAQWIAVLVYRRHHTHQSTAFVWLMVFVGLPVALFCIYRIASALGGRWLGALTALVWVVVPFAMIHLFDPRYRVTYENRIVPRSIGLTESGEFPTMVLLLVACLFLLRALRDGRFRALAGGLVAGGAAMVDAAGLLFVPAVLVALLAAGRRKLIVAFALGLLPGIVVVLSRHTGGAIAFGSWHQFKQNGIFIREFFYSLRILEFLPIAGFLALGRRSIPGALLIGGWFATFLFIQGTSSAVADYTFWRPMLPALPAYVLLASALPLLVPAPRAFRESFFPTGLRFPRRVR
jgi:hypothetical protein